MKMVWHKTIHVYFYEFFTFKSEHVARFDATQVAPACVVCGIKQRNKAPIIIFIMKNRRFMSATIIDMITFTDYMHSFTQDRPAL